MMIARLEFMLWWFCQKGMSGGGSMNRHRGLANVLPFLPAKVRQNLRIRKYCGALLYSIVPPSAVMTEKVPCKKPRQEWIYRTLCMEIYSATENSSFPTPQRGHSKSSGSSSKGVPGAMPASGSPSAGLYSQPQTSQT